MEYIEELRKLIEESKSQTKKRELELVDIISGKLVQFNSIEDLNFTSNSPFLEKIEINSTKLEKAYINISSSKITNLDKLFKECPNLIHLKIVGDNRKVSINHICENLKQLTYVEFENLKISNASNSFANCEKLCCNLNFEIYGNSDSMFINCKNLKRIQISGESINFNSRNMFSFCEKLSEICISDYKIENSNCISMFSFCKSLKEIKLNENFNPNLFMTGFDGCDSLTKVSFFKLQGDLNCLFRNCINLVEINGISLISKPAYQIFRNCKSLDRINCKEIIFDGDCHYLFENCKQICNFLLQENVNSLNYFLSSTQITKINLNIPLKCETAEGIFSNCENLEEVNLSSNSEYIQNLSEAFKNCKKLKRIDLSKISNFSKYLNFQGMFENCENLEEVKLTENKINIYKSSNLTNMFYNCKSLENFDLNQFKFIIDDYNAGYFNTFYMFENTKIKELNIADGNIEFKVANCSLQILNSHSYPEDTKINCSQHILRYFK